MDALSNGHFLLKPHPTASCHRKGADGAGAQTERRSCWGAAVVAGGWVGADKPQIPGAGASLSRQSSPPLEGSTAHAPSLPTAQASPSPIHVTC